MYYCNFIANAEWALHIPLHICANALSSRSLPTTHVTVNNRIFPDFHLHLHLTDVRVSRFILTLAPLFASINKLIRSTIENCICYLFKSKFIKIYEFVILFEWISNKYLILREKIKLLVAYREKRIKVLSIMIKLQLYTIDHTNRIKKSSININRTREIK